MNLTINGKAIKKQTFVILGLLIGGAITTQVAAVNHFLSYHPHLAPLGGWIISILTLLHEPWVRQLIFQQSEQQPDGTEVQTKIAMPIDAPKP